MIAVQDDRAAFRRVDWGGVGGDEDWIFLAEDIHSAFFKMQIRPLPGDTADPLVALVNAPAGSLGISATYQADYADPETGAIVGATIVTPFIPAEAMAGVGLPLTSPEAPLPLYYDPYVAIPGGLRQLRAYGGFLLYPGVTIA